VQYYEKNVSTQQKKASKIMRLSQENENSQRTTGHQPSPQSRPQALNHSLSFPKTARLRTRQDYRRVQKASQRIHGHQISMECHRGSQKGLPCPKLGITVSKKYGKAHERNYFKRLVREAFRESRPYFPQDLEINVTPRPGMTQRMTQPTKKGILEDLALAYAQPTAKKSG